MSVVMPCKPVPCEFDEIRQFRLRLTQYFGSFCACAQSIRSRNWVRRQLGVFWQFEHSDLLLLLLFPLMIAAPWREIRAQYVLRKGGGGS